MKCSSSFGLLPGVMPIETYDSLIRRASWTQFRIPSDWLAKLEPIKIDDAQVRQVGKDLVVEFCRKVLDSGTTMHLHFYTMNLAASTAMVLESLSVTPSPDAHYPDLKPLPWRQSLGFNSRDENVRPISGATENNLSSPARKTGTNSQTATGRRPTSHIRWPGRLREANVLRQDLMDLNAWGLLTINSQPAVNGAKSSHATYGWGLKGGYVYQKAYLEVMIQPALLAALLERMECNVDITSYAVNQLGELKTNVLGDGGLNAVTRGVFSGKGIVQPTIVERWAKCYDEGSDARGLIKEVVETWYLVNIVDNDHRNQRGSSRCSRGWGWRGDVGVETRGLGKEHSEGKTGEGGGDVKVNEVKTNGGAHGNGAVDGLTKTGAGRK
ncbi:methylenetetrahydrofolate reductase (NAD(P)H) met13 [Elasticomyces elasticus]|nr:methylenetetrahydrofolate reductase (NAD(P)H) met13 [Elasticomyces elasticus]